MKVTGSDLMKLLRMVTTLSIIHNPTFWVAHDAYLSSRFKLLQVLEKYTLLGAIVRQYEKSKQEFKAALLAERARSLVVDCNRSGEIGYRIPAWGECERQARVPVPDGTVGA